MEENTICSSCGGTFPKDQLTFFDDHYFCGECLFTETEVCSHCGTRIYSGDNEGSHEHPLCRSCFESYYTNCNRCGVLIAERDAYYPDDESDEGYCASCHRYITEHYTIQGYYFKPTPVFHGDGPRYFGVELEIDEGGENHYHAETLSNLANAAANNIYCKHDGSLNDGFEIVTHPMSLDYHLHEMPWEKITQEAIRLGYYSHQANTCGLHVHVSRTAFGNSLAEQECVIARILYFVEKHWDELLKFSRRTPRQLERWASRYGYKDHPLDILDHAKNGDIGRYASVNLENSDTIEFRIFRGTLKYNTLIATLQLVDRVCDVAISLSDEELKALSWTTFVSGCTQPELILYLKERSLYINEPVESEVEV